jgi:DNA-binding MarR family transcriptional regulator
MQPKFEIPLPGLLEIASDAIREEIYDRLGLSGYAGLRPTHSCVFGTIGQEGDRLTALADRARMTKQAVGEVVSELEKLGYVERVPDPSDGRAKIIRLTARGEQAYAEGMAIIDEIKARWSERYGAERVENLTALLAEIAADERAAHPGAPRSAAA